MLGVGFWVGVYLRVRMLACFGSIRCFSMWVYDCGSSEGVWYVVTGSRTGYVGSTQSSVDGLSCECE